jgi:hypothetical protein
MWLSRTAAKGANAFSQAFQLEPIYEGLDYHRLPTVRNVPDKKRRELEAQATGDEAGPGETCPFERAKNVPLLYRRHANSRDFRGCNHCYRRFAAALVFSSICGKMMMDSRKCQYKAGLFESYLRSQIQNPKDLSEAILKSRTYRNLQVALSVKPLDC